MEIYSELNMYNRVFFIVIVFGLLSYSELFSFQAWKKKYLEKNPMSLLMIWVSIQILMYFCNLINIFYSNFQFTL